MLPTSLIDYPGKVSCVVFLTGCNLRCPYCHNPELALGQMPQRLSIKGLEKFLLSRRGLLDAVVISGGEPTLNPCLADLCLLIKQMGFSVKLDTNGTRPKVIEHLLEAKLVDYLAMDIKTAPETYKPYLCPQDLNQKLRESIFLVMSRAPDYEFRTTCIEPFINHSVIRQIGELVRGARSYFLQQARTGVCLDSSFFQPTGPGRALDNLQIKALGQILNKYVKTCNLR